MRSSHNLLSAGYGGDCNCPHLGREARPVAAFLILYCLDKGRASNSAFLAKNGVARARRLRTRGSLWETFGCLACARAEPLVSVRTGLELNDGGFS